jgi:hypothetical protein
LDIDYHGKINQSEKGLKEKFSCLRFITSFGLVCDSKCNSFKGLGKKMLLVQYTNCEHTSLMKLIRRDIRVQMTAELCEY